jgi:guanylate kinase
MLISKYPDVFEEIVSMTTRPRRKTETNGVDYHFVTKE